MLCGVAAAHQRHLRRQAAGVEVAPVVVGVADDDLAGAGRQAAGEHGVEIGAHVPARELGGGSLAVGVALGHHAADAFEVDGDEQLHGPSILRAGAGQARGSNVLPAPQTPPARRASAATRCAAASRSPACATSNGECM